MSSKEQSPLINGWWWWLGEGVFKKNNGLFTEITSYVLAMDYIRCESLILIRYFFYKGFYFQLLIMICLLIAFFSYCAGALGGRKLSEEEGYFNDNRKPSGFDTMQIFVSPSVRFRYLPLTGSRIYRHTSSDRNRSLFSLCSHETGAPS